MVAVEDLEMEDGMALPKEARGILHNLASTWSDVADHKELEVIQLKGAMTNQVYQINWMPRKEDGTPRKVLVRIYGEGVDAFFDRADEIRTFESMSKHGQGPKLLARFPHGRVEEFIHAKTLSASDLRDPESSALIAAKLWEFHGLDMIGPKKSALWDRLRVWLKEAKDLATTAESQEFRLDLLDDEITTLQKNLQVANEIIGFCHNDLQYGNIMMDEETKLVTIIDYEYASFNPIAYDIANHFCEMAADYHTETPHILNYNKYPEREEQKRFLCAYLASSGKQPCNTEVENLLQEVDKYSLASHLVWGLWGIISEHVNEIDFDYLAYARQRLRQYWMKKPALLGA